MNGASLLLLAILSLGMIGCGAGDAGTSAKGPAATNERSDGLAQTTPGGSGEQSPSNEAIYHEARKEMSEASDALQDLAARQKDEFLKQVNAQLQDVDTSMKTIEEQAGKLTDQARKRVERRLAIVAAKRRDLVDRLQELETSSGSAWEKFREGVRNAWDELKKSHDDASHGISVEVGNGVDVKVGDGVEVDVGKDGVGVNVKPHE